MQDIFKRLINEIFLLKFKPYGWKKQGSNFRYIDASGLGRVINFQKSKWNTADEYSGLGVRAVRWLGNRLAII